MAQHKNAGPKPWLTATMNGGRSAGGRYLPYIQADASLFQSEAFTKLNPSARITYLCMAIEAKGRSAFTFTHGICGKYGLSNSGFDKSLKELQSSGFIRCIQNNANLRKPNLYEFSYSWKTNPH